MMASSEERMHQQDGNTPGEFATTSSLESLHTHEQRLVLDTVSQIRKCGLESVLSLPQLVVCGDQSAGKSSVLEALTEIPFPRNDNLCTRFATEIILRRAPKNSLTVKVIPDPVRPVSEQDSIKRFKESISDFQELPNVMHKAMAVMGIEGDPAFGSQARAFAKDVLSVEIEGPARPQLTLVDLPGLIQTDTKGVTKADVNLVAEITDQYISQPRTICLAVVSASTDYANQGILSKVREVDPKGERTLGIITKPDRLPSGSGSEESYINLAQNKDVFFKLGWHVIKNRSFEETSNTFVERNASEASYFSRSNFKSLPKDCVGIESLRKRLSQQLFDHVKQELPRLREDLDEALSDSKSQLKLLGGPRATPQDCRAYLTELSQSYFEVCKAAVDGYYEGNFFISSDAQVFSPKSPATIRRLRALVQFMNTEFANVLRLRGHKYHFADWENAEELPPDEETSSINSKSEPGTPIKRTHAEALDWVSQVLIRTRGRELPGNFNPLLVGELFWEQSCNWQRLAADHVDRVAEVCHQFLEILLQEKCPDDIRSRLWSFQIRDQLKRREEGSFEELRKITEELQSYPVNYNHYYTDTITKRRQDRQQKFLREKIASATQDPLDEEVSSTTIDLEQFLKEYSERTNPDMEKHSCEDALDCLYSIYKTSQKTFTANVTTQVIERHIVRGLETIFSPIAVSQLSDTETEAIASEPVSAKRQREFLMDRIEKLEAGHDILRGVIKST